MTAHTPWEAKIDGDGNFYVCQPGLRSIINAGAIGPADALHIVACVNAHDKLVADLERCKAALLDMVAYADNQDNTNEVLLSHRQATNRARALLAELDKGVA